MSISLTPLDPLGADRHELIEFISSQEWPFHVERQLTREGVANSINAGRFQNRDVESFWIDHSEHGHVGVFRLEDLTDDTPLLDIRIDEKWRGRGFAVETIHAATEFVFHTRPKTLRFEGQTRDDNLAMRAVFRKAGWVKEAYYREGWPVEGGEPRASVAYAVLRRDWESGTVTPVPWEEPWC